MTGTLIVINNYLHDVATAVLLATAVVMWMLARAGGRGDSGELELLRGAYPVLTRFAWGALAWIVVGGVPRTVFFSRYEWDLGQVPGLVAALGVKHALMFAAVVFGLILWRRARGVLGPGADDGSRARTTVTGT